MANFDPQKKENWGHKKDIPQIHKDKYILQKKNKSELVIFGLRGPIYNLHPRFSFWPLP